MKTRPLILLAAALTLAAGSALVARALLRPPPPVTIIKEVEVAASPQAAQSRPQVLALGRPLAPGDFIEGSALAWQDMPAEAVRADHFAAANDAERRQVERAIYGATLRRPVAAGSPLARDVLVYAGEPGFLAAVLSPGMRAISIPTSFVSSNAGLVAAGDRVDVILSLNRKDLTQPSPAPNSSYTILASQTIVRGVRVLALDSEAASLAPHVAAGSGAEAEPAADAKPRTPPRPAAVYESVTLEVTPAAAEQLVLAREIGTLQVALHSVRDEPSGAAPARGVTRIGDATDIFNGFPRPVTVGTFHGARQAEQVFASPAP